MSHFRTDYQKPIVLSPQIRQPQYNITPRQTVGYIPNFNQNFPNNNPQIPNPFNRQFNVPVAKPSFPQQPINIQPRQLPPQKFLTNSKVFGKPQNVFKPKNQVPSYKPTPMSITSKTVVPRTYNTFQPSGSRNWTNAEMHNIKEESTPLEEYQTDELEQETYENQYYTEYPHQYYEYGQSPEAQEQFQEMQQQQLPQQQESNFRLGTNKNNPT